MIYMFLAEGFEETEALAPLDILRRAGCEVTTVGVGARTVCGSHGISVVADITEDMLDTELNGIEMVILPGGMPGTLNLDACKTVHRAIEKAVEKGAFVAAICAAPMILGKKGLLANKNAVCYPGFEKHLTGATVSDQKVVMDGRFITAKGMGVATEFGLMLISALKGDKLSNDIRLAIMM